MEFDDFYQQFIGDNCSVTIDSRPYLTETVNHDHGTVDFRMGPVLQAWFKEQQLELMSLVLDGNWDKAQFFFPKDKADIAALFKLRFG